MTEALGFFSPWSVYLLVLGLHLALPARSVEGYVRDSEGKPLRYRLNGLPVLIVSVLIWFAFGYLGLIPWDWLYQVRWWSLAGAVFLGLMFTIAVVLPAPPSGRGLIAELFLGRRENPQWLSQRVDAKMMLYLLGAIMLELNLLAFATYHVQRSSYEGSYGVILHVALFTWFVVDYFAFEKVHLYTYDFVAERVGFKLGWGCLAFYPYFYAIGLWAVVAKPEPGVGGGFLTLAAVMFFCGWALSRGANLQKFCFKRDPERAFLGIAPESIRDGDRALLCNGFWGVARHVNYLGELLMSIGLTMSLGYPGAWLPWLYPLYYVALLVPRERDDDRRCAEKYGELWERYRERVPRRIIPGVY
ncbi:MAG: DUF1295 domain-containing protein [Myxococcota bacterium]